MSSNAARATAAVVLALVAPLAGCAAARKTRPLDMSAVGHEQAAREASARGKAKLAAAHADAARSLRAAEERACDGVPSRDIAPGVSGLDVVRTSVLERPLKAIEVPEGTAVVVAANGRSFEAIERMMRCRAARATVTRDPQDPLAVPGTVLRVYRDDGDAVVVQLRSRDWDRAAEISRRVARQVHAGTREASPAEPTEPQGLARARDDGGHDPRTHAAEPAPGGLAPIDGSTGVARRP